MYLDMDMLYILHNESGSKMEVLLSISTHPISHGDIES